MVASMHSPWASRPSLGFQGQKHGKNFGGAFSTKSKFQPKHKNGFISSTKPSGPFQSPSGPHGKIVQKRKAPVNISDGEGWRKQKDQKKESQSHVQVAQARPATDDTYETHVSTNLEIFSRRIEFHKSTMASTGFTRGMELGALKQNPKLGVAGSAKQEPTIENDLPRPSKSLFDPQRVEAMTAWKRPSKVGPGLYNLGNTCFLNSVLQCLTYTPPLAQLFANEEINSLVKGRSTNGTLDALGQLQHHMRKALTSSSQSPIAPKAIATNIRMIGKQFRIGRQEDAHEFLRCLVDAMQKSCLKAAGLKENAPGGIAETTFIHSIFGGYLQSQVKCTQCSYASNTFDPMLDLCLELRKGIESVFYALKHYTAVETLDDENRWKCSRCNKKVRAKKQLTIRKAPNVLTIQLKRFAYGPYGGKINKHVAFKEHLDLSPFMSRPSQNPGNEPTSKQAPLDSSHCTYQLYGVLVHWGHSTNSGHYYSYIRNSTGTWHQMDDSSVSRVSIDTVLSQKAYILFYVKTPPPAKMTKELAPSAALSAPAEQTSAKTAAAEAPKSKASKVVDAFMRDGLLSQTLEEQEKAVAMNDKTEKKNAAMAPTDVDDIGVPEERKDHQLSSKDKDAEKVSSLASFVAAWKQQQPESGERASGTKGDLNSPHFSGRAESPSSEDLQRSAQTIAQSSSIDTAADKTLKSSRQPLLSVRASRKGLSRLLYFSKLNSLYRYQSTRGTFPSDLSYISHLRRLREKEESMSDEEDEEEADETEGEMVIVKMEEEQEMDGSDTDSDSLQSDSASSSSDRSSPHTLSAASDVSASSPETKVHEREAQGQSNNGGQVAKTIREAGRSLSRAEEGKVVLAKKKKGKGGGFNPATLRGQGLLGKDVRQWNDEGEEVGDAADGSLLEMQKDHNRLLREAVREESQWRNMGKLDEWDASLDQGRQKKVKQKVSLEEKFPMGEANPFQAATEAKQTQGRKEHIDHSRTDEAHGSRPFRPRKGYLGKGDGPKPRHQKGKGPFGRQNGQKHSSQNGHYGPQKSSHQLKNGNFNRHNGSQRKPFSK